MKYIVVSDNHRNRTVLEQLYRYYENEPVIFFHCGDSELLYDDPLWQQTVRVSGNCDMDSRYPHVEVLKQDNHTILMTHGHRQHVNTSRKWLVDLAKQHQASVVFYGHTHIREAMVYDRVLCINPGSIAYPRGQFSMQPSYAVVDLTNISVEVTYFTQDHHPIADWSYTFTFDKKDGGWL